MLVHCFEGCYLFHYEGTDIIHQFDDMEFEIGIVPFPKYDTEQDEYYSLYPHDALLVAVPSKIENLERTANIIEDLNHISKRFLKSAWFDSLVERKYRFDDESLEMLDIIYETRVYDIGLYYDFGGIRSGVLEQDVSKYDISDLYEAKKNDINTDIKNFYRDFGFVD